MQEQVAELISVGTELMTGSILNTNARFLAQALTDLGIEVGYQITVGDNPGRLREVVETARHRATILVTTGGLGPTYDDLTKRTVAESYRVPLVRHLESEARIRAYFAAKDPERPMPESNLVQADVLEGSIVLDNQWGTAPGCIYETDCDTRVIMLPGPPDECIPMFNTYVAPYLESFSFQTIRSRSFRVFGMGESEVESSLRPWIDTLYRDLRVATYAKPGEVEVRLTGTTATAERTQQRLAAGDRKVRQTLGDLIYGVDEDSLEEVVLRGLRQKGLTFGCAESCTGGLIAQRMTALPGASAVFRGGLVTYWSETKAALLGVPRDLLEEKGAVDPTVAVKMAQGARKALNCDLAVAVTGVAGPDRDERDNPVGLVYVALAAPDGEWCRETHLGTGRARVRMTAANHAFDMVRRYLSGLPICP